MRIVLKRIGTTCLFERVESEYVAEISWWHMVNGDIADGQEIMQCICVHHISRLLETA